MTDTLIQITNAVFLLTLAATFWATYKKTRVWFHPAALLSAAWLMYLGIPYMVGLGHPIQPIGVLYITLFVMIFAATSFCFTWGPVLYKNHADVSPGSPLSTKLIQSVFIASAITSSAFVLLDAMHQGFSLSIDLLSIAGEYAERRYAGALIPNIYAKLGLLTCFQSAVFGGILFGMCRSKRSQVIVVAAAMVPAVLVMLLQSAKGLFFLSAALFAGGWLLTRIQKNDYAPPRIPVLTAVTVLVLAFALIMVSFIARVGMDADILRYYVASYSSGHIYAFSEWMSVRYLGTSSTEHFDQPFLQGGFFTFMGIFQALGDNRAVPLGKVCTTSATA